MGYNGQDHNISVMSSHLPRDEALEKEDRIDEIKKIKNRSPVPHLLQVQQASVLLYAKVHLHLDITRESGATWPTVLVKRTVLKRTWLKMTFVTLSTFVSVCLPLINVILCFITLTYCLFDLQLFSLVITIWIINDSFNKHAEKAEFIPCLWVLISVCVQRSWFSPIHICMYF